MGDVLHGLDALLDSEGTQPPGATHATVGACRSLHASMLLLRLAIAGCPDPPRPRPSSASGPTTSDHGKAAGSSRSSGTPALRRPSIMGSSWARDISGRRLSPSRHRAAGAIVKVGLSERPAFTAECASSSRPSCARAADSTKFVSGLFRLASIARRYHATACSRLPRWFFAIPRCASTCKPACHGG